MHLPGQNKKARPWHRGVGLAIALLAADPAWAQSDLLARAISDARDAFAAARPALGTRYAGVDVEAFAQALSGGVDYVLADASNPDCGRFAAYVVPVDGGGLTVFICPRFFMPGAEALRRLTILHELVHAVADADECRAMAFAGAVERYGTGRATRVDSYWQRHDCAESPFTLPD